ncbi:MAG: hypothetical protein AB1714_08525 [Acidobacteriota bacterium]
MKVEDYGKAVLILAAVASAFALGFFIGSETEKAKIPDYQDDNYDELT